MNKNLIAICGKKQMGKNTVADIIQYLTRDYVYIDYSFEQYFQLNTTKYYKKKSFAYKLKQITSILLNIPIEDLEKEEIKNQVLPEQWSKDCSIWVSSQEMDLWLHKGHITTKKRDIEYKLIENKVWFKHNLQPITVREFLQKLGTDAMRDGLHKNVWVNALFSGYKDEWNGMNTFDNTSKYPNWIITDLRFPNELQAVRERQGLVIRVFRPNILKVYFNDPIGEEDEHDNSGQYWVENINENGEWVLNNNTFSHQIITISHHIKFLDDRDAHLSETALDNIYIEEFIFNNGTIEDLIEKTKQILIKHKIIEDDNTKL